jgi:hypothetical protein
MIKKKNYDSGKPAEEYFKAIGALEIFDAPVIRD